MERAGLLKWFLDIFRSLMPETKHNSADEILYVRRILQPATKCNLHPRARFLRRAQNRIAAAMSNEHAFLGIANKQTSAHVAAREIGAHIEFAGIPGRCDRFRDSKKSEFVAKLRFATPADKPRCARRLVFTFEFNRFELQQECGEAVRGDLRLADDE